MTNAQLKVLVHKLVLIHLLWGDRPRKPEEKKP